MFSMNRWLPVILAMGLGLIESVRQAAAADCSEDGIGELGFGLIEHSCFHTTNGPFAQVTATTGSVASAGTANVDPVHTQYTIAITPAQSNVVVYTPVRSGNWALFSEVEMRQRMFDAAGRELPVRLTHSVQGCDALPLVRVFTLTAFERYTIRLGSPTVAATSTRLVIEKVSDFEAIHGRDGDGDGYGGAEDTVTTPCVPPAGYVQNVSDCNDGDPAIHPDAEEACNGADDNCNGLADEDACQIGGGGCAIAALPDQGDGPSPLWLGVSALLLLRIRRGARQRRGRS